LIPRWRHRGQTTALRRFLRSGAAAADRQAASPVAESRAAPAPPDQAAAAGSLPTEESDHRASDRSAADPLLDSTRPKDLKNPTDLKNQMDSTLLTDLKSQTDLKNPTDLKNQMDSTLLTDLKSQTDLKNPTDSTLLTDLKNPTDSTLLTGSIVPIDQAQQVPAPMLPTWAASRLREPVACYLCRHSFVHLPAQLDKRLQSDPQTPSRRSVDDDVRWRHWMITQ